MAFLPRLSQAITSLTDSIKALGKLPPSLTAPATSLSLMAMLVPLELTPRFIRFIIHRVLRALRTIPARDRAKTIILRIILSSAGRPEDLIPAHATQQQT